MCERSNGLLRGSREERMEEMHSLRGAEWDLYTFLDLHTGLLDHAENVRLAVLDTLMEMSKRAPKAITLSPISLLVHYIFSVTVSSGYRHYIFRFLVQLGTPEAHKAVEKIMKNTARNEDFRNFVDLLTREGWLNLLKNLEKEEWSKPKAEILHCALNGGERKRG